MCADGGFTMTEREAKCCSAYIQEKDGIRDIGVTGVQTCALPKEEYGIRDIGVTGVQTCALPISPPITRKIWLLWKEYHTRDWWGPGLSDPNWKAPSETNSDNGARNIDRDMKQKLGELADRKSVV